MQYYERPVNEDNEIMFSALDRFIDCIDKIYEFRVLGGDPFMNKELNKIINELVKYSNIGRIVVYTNARFIPKNQNLDYLKQPRVNHEKHRNLG